MFNPWRGSRAIENRVKRSVWENFRQCPNLGLWLVGAQVTALQRGSLNKMGWKLGEENPPPGLSSCRKCVILIMSLVRVSAVIKSSGNNCDFIQSLV